MRIQSIALRDVGPYRDARIDLSSVSGIIAVTGANGAGKSTLLRAAAAISDKRERLAMLSRARTRSAVVELTYSTGPLSRVTMTLDGVSGRTEVVARLADGSDALSGSTAVSAWDRWAADRLLSSDVYSATIYAAQGAGGWIGLPTAERRRIVLLCIGSERLERMSAAARARVSGIAAKIADTGSRLEATRQRAHVELSRAAVVGAEDRTRDAGSLLAAARERLDRAREEHAAVVAAYSDAVAARKRAEEAQAALRTAREALRTITDQRERQRPVLAAAAEIDAAAAAIPEAEAEAARLREAAEYVRATRTEAEGAVREASAALSAAQRERDRTATEAAGMRTQLTTQEAAAKDLESLRLLQTRAEDLESAAVTAEERSHAADEESREAGRLALGLADRRITGLRDGLALIADAPSLVDARGTAERTMESDVLLAEQGSRERVASLTDAAAMARRIAVEARSASDTAHRSLSRLPAVEAAAARVAELVPLLREADERRNDAITAMRAAEQRLTDTKACLVSAADAYSAASIAALGADDRLAKLRKVAARGAEIAAARATDEQLAVREADARTALAAAQEAVRLAPEPPALPPVPPDLSTLEAAVAREEAALDAAQRHEQRARFSLAEAESALAEAERLTQERLALEETQARWTRLSDDLGQRGLIALEVDAAGPEIAATANGLLRAGFGSRWSLDVRTVRPRADGSGEVEVCEVVVTDTHTGYHGPIDSLSGGEAVVVSEALRMALTGLSLRRLGMQSPTLIRDEPAGALSASRPIAGCDSASPATEQHLRMLRHAATLCGSDVLLVSHDPRVPEICDARVRVESGSLSLD